jgi:hypothetical protein|tara:strand:- start:399 stop:530 length:132 start_codon:yes stop_codon:yes gene_type:complete
MSSQKQALGIQYSRNTQDFEGLSFRNARAGTSPVSGDIYNKEV